MINDKSNQFIKTLNHFKCTNLAAANTHMETPNHTTHLYFNNKHSNRLSLVNSYKYPVRCDFAPLLQFSQPALSEKCNVEHSKLSRALLHLEWQ